MPKRAKTEVDFSDVQNLSGELLDSLKSFRRHVPPLRSRSQYNVTESTNIIQMIIFLSEHLHEIGASTMSAIEIPANHEFTQVHDIQFSPDAKFVEICKSLGLKIHDVYNDEPIGQWYKLYSLLKLTLINTTQIAVLNRALRNFGARVDSLNSSPES